jgi:hypothetical protein
MSIIEVGDYIYDSTSATEGKHFSFVTNEE